MISTGFLEEAHDDPICFGHMFAVPHKEQRRRIIYEPFMNPALKSFFKEEYHHVYRRERRFPHEAAVQIDFASYFSQFVLSPQVRRYFGVRIANTTQTYQLRTLPMGAIHSPWIAQISTWAIVSSLPRRPDIKLDAYLDNVRISGPSLPVKSTLQELLSTCQRIGVVVNPMEVRPPSSPYNFLGEHFIPGQGTANTEATLTKIRDFWQIILSATSIKIRHFCAFIGLLLFACHTVDLHLSRLRAVLSFLRALSCQAVVSWEAPVPFVSPHILLALGKVVRFLLDNQTVPFPQKLSELPTIANYVMYFDASKEGAAAIVLGAGSCKTLQYRFPIPHPESATAEPAGCSILLAHVLQDCPPAANVLLFTDHMAIVQSSINYSTFHGGFSSNSSLNNLHRGIVERFLHDGTRVHLRHIAGQENPADLPSRRLVGDKGIIVSLPTEWVAASDTFVIPQQAVVSHPPWVV
jgi:hypothetical protein